VASAIGSAGADIVAVDVLESQAGQALDDVFVQVRDAGHLDRVTGALAALAGVELVGTQHPAPPAGGHADLDLVGQVVRGADRAAQTLVDGAPGALGADWALLVAFGEDGAQGPVLASSVRAPAGARLDVHTPLRLASARVTGPDGEPYAGTALVPLGDLPLALVLVREHGVQFHRTELWRLATLGTIVAPAVAGAVTAQRP
jgi:hypothetical protein